MSGLGGKIEIGSEYRPCMVHIPAKTKTKRNNEGGKSIKIIEEEREIKALFHCWSHRSELCDASPMLGGHPGGQVSATFGIVEYEAGTVHEIKPQNIRFVDGLINQYGFREDNDERED